MCLWARYAQDIPTQIHDWQCVGSEDGEEAKKLVEQARWGTDPFACGFVSIRNPQLLKTVRKSEEPRVPGFLTLMKYAHAPCVCITGVSEESSRGGRDPKR